MYKKLGQQPYILQISAYQSYNISPDVEKSVSNICITDDNICQLEVFIILLYKRTSERTQVNQAETRLFAKGSTSRELHTKQLIFGVS